MIEHKLFYINADGCEVVDHVSNREEAMPRIKEILGTFNEAHFERILVKPYRSRYAQYEDETSTELRYVPVESKLRPITKRLVKAMRKHKLLNAGGSCFRPDSNKVSDSKIAETIPVFVTMWDTGTLCKDGWPVLHELLPPGGIEDPKVVLYIESIYRKKISDTADIPKQYVFTTELYGYRAGLIDAKVVEKLFEASMNPFLFTTN